MADHNSSWLGRDAITKILQFIPSEVVSLAGGVIVLQTLVVKDVVMYASWMRSSWLLQTFLFLRKQCCWTRLICDEVGEILSAAEAVSCSPRMALVVFHVVPFLMICFDMDCKAVAFAIKGLPI